MSDKQRTGGAASDDGACEPVPSDLAGLRERIDAVDRSILEQLNERARLVKLVGEEKRTRQAPVYVAGRERDLIARLCNANPGPFPSSAIPHVFREIISATRSLEEVVRVAFLGPEGTFCHQAVFRQFGAQIEGMPAASMREVFALTQKGKSHYGIVAVENTIEGAVAETFDALVESDLSICGELMLEVTECLMSKSGRLEDVRKVASHPQALGQCRGWLQRELPNAELIGTSSTAAAAKLASGDPQVAAVGSEVSAEVYGLKLIEQEIEDSPGNTTRFLVIGREAPASSGDDLTSAVFTVRKDESGALYRLLQPFAVHGVNLNSIQSRPMKGKPWEYLFFVDMRGHAEDEAVAKALRDAASAAHSHKVLGSYPRAAGAPRAAAAPRVVRNDGDGVTGEAGDRDALQRGGRG
jgi:chorismate mutase/prephenate dehydratase